MEGNTVSSFPPGSREAMEQEVRSQKIVDFLKFHDSVPLPEPSHSRNLQQGNPRFGTPQSLGASPSPSISPPVEEADTPIPSRSEQVKQLFNSQQRKPEQKAIGVHGNSTAFAPQSVPLPPSRSRRDLSSPHPIGQIGHFKSSSSSTGSYTALFAAMACSCCSHYVADTSRLRIAMSYHLAWCDALCEVY